LINNWPYDFFSFVEKVSIDAEVLLKQDNDILVTRDELEKSEQMDFSRIVRTNVLAPYNPNTKIVTNTTGVTYTQFGTPSLSDQFEMSTGNEPPDSGPLY
jgi:hypothetical protein